MAFENPQIIVGAIVITAVAALVYCSITDNVKAPKVGYTWYTLSMSRSILENVKKTLTEGYRKFPDGFFKIKLYPYGTITVVMNKKLVNELRNAPNEALDFAGGTARPVLPEYTFSRELTESFHHFVPTIRTTLTRNLGLLFGDIVDEMKTSFGDCLTLTRNEWKSMPAYETMMNVICRTTNRVTVGLPHCRDPEFCKINVTYTVDVIYTAAKINLFPNFLHPIVGPLLSKALKYQRRALDIIEPTIQHRREMLDTYGPGWADKPNDYLTWTMEEETTGPLARDPMYLALRVLHINFAAIHTSTMTFTHALYYLAIYPEYAEILREEAFTIIGQEGGWTKEAMRKMVKADSFLRESARLNAIQLLTLIREAKKDYTFSNGLKITKGNYVGTSLYSIHHDESIYKDAHKFNPWRFVDNDLERGSDGVSPQQYVATSPEYLAFGSGKHACPGRFFAANELKAMLCYVVTNYDLQLPHDSKERPVNHYIGSSVIPNTEAHVMFRKRNNTPTL